MRLSANYIKTKCSPPRQCRNSWRYHRRRRPWPPAPLHHAVCTGLGAPCQEQGRLDPCDLDRASLATSVGGGLAMNTRWITDFRALRTLLPVVAADRKRGV